MIHTDKKESATPRTDAVVKRLIDGSVPVASTLATHAEELERELAETREAYLNMAARWNGGTPVSAPSASAERDAIIEQCASIADREWVGENSLIGSRVSRKIANCIRDLKSSYVQGSSSGG